MDERRGLLKFINPSAEPLRVLSAESFSYVDELQRLMPNADFRVVAQEHCAALGRASFDLIVAEDAFTLAHEPYDMLRDLGQALTDIGTLITQYENIRFVGVLEQLRLGFYPERRRRLYAKPEVVRLLNDALFKEITFAPDNVLSVSVDEWINFGFDNFSDDLKVKTWLVKAGRSKAEVAALKQCFTPTIRAELSLLIHRIEYDIDRKENFDRLFALCAQEAIFDDYLRDFILSTVAHHSRLKFFREAASARGIELDFD